MRLARSLRPPPAEGGGGHDDVEFLWLISFSDMMTNLMLFFLTLYGLTQVAAAQRAQNLKAIQEKFGGRQVVEQVEPEDPAVVEARKHEATAEKIREALQSQGLGGAAQVGVSERQVKVTLQAPILFGSGSSDVKAEALAALKGIAEVVKGTPYRVVVEGHADANPIRRGGQSYANWELSAARAFSVVRFFMETCGFPPDRLSAVGYGEFRPVAPNDTEEHRALNRRIEVRLVAPIGGTSG